MIMARLHLEMLGGFDARDAEGRSISLPTRKAQALLACLGLQAGRWHSRETLAGLLWGRSGDEQARNSLRQTLSSLRRALAPYSADVLLASSDGIALDADGTSSDVARFETLLKNAAAPDLPRAVDLYRGELLEGFSLREEAFEEWLEGERRRLHESATRAMATELDHCVSGSHVDRGIDVAGRLLNLDPLREEAHRGLMRLYAQSGRRGAALQQYEQCRERHQRELGTRPEPETDRLASDIRQQPRTEYTSCGDIDIAYQVLGDGPIDLVYVPGWVSHVEYGWEYSGYARFLRSLAAFSRLIVLDKRGSGLSEREVDNPSLEERMDDVRAVMDAVGSEKAAILGVSESGSLACLFAANNPDRTSALILHGCFAKRLKSSDYPYGYDEEYFQAWLDGISRDWGGRMVIENMAPSMDVDSEFHDWFSKFLRYSVSRRAALKLTKLNAGIDVRGVLPAIHVPALVMRRHGDRIATAGDANYLAEHIENARLVELPGEDHVPFTGDADDVAEEIRNFLTDIEKPLRATEHILLAVAVVEAGEGSQPYKADRESAAPDLTGQAIVEEAARYHGSEAQTENGVTGTVLTFDGPERAIRCATAVRSRLGALGMTGRVGIHVGTCDVRGGRVSGATLHLASRIKQRARGDEILVSRTVKDLCIGTGIRYERAGDIEMEDVGECWELYAVTTD